MVTPLHKNLVNIELGGQKNKALVDTGSSVTAISTKFLNQTYFANRTLSRDGILKIFSADGTSHNVLGRIDLSFRSGPKVFRNKFLVIPDLDHTIVLGMDFLRLNKASLDLDKQTLYLNDNKVKVNLLQSNSQLARVRSYDTRQTMVYSTY